MRSEGENEAGCGCRGGNSPEDPSVRKSQIGAASNPVMKQSGFGTFLTTTKEEKGVSTLRLSLLLIQGKEQGIDNSIKFMFTERAPRGSPQPIVGRIQS